MAKIIGGLVVVLVVIIVGNFLLPVPRAAISVAAEPIGLGPITNSLLTSFILSVIIVIGAAVVGSSLKLVPGGLQNVVELLIEALMKFVNDIAPRKWAGTFFPILATIFIYVLFANWFGLLTPLLGSFGIVHSTDQGGIPVKNVVFVSGSPETMTPMHHPGAEEGGHEAEAEHGGEKQAVIVPFFRAPSSDLNLTFALALISVILTQVFGVWELGLGYFGKFFQFGSFATKGFGLGLIDFFMGIIELISEFAKILSFAFRLFGNIFAGEVIMIIMSSLVSLLLVIIFFGLEIFVGFIQAFVFFILSLVFFSMATQSHGEHSEHHH
ncbi:MAG: F0F1 ATP synthase subunit A [Anaerolineae bacterium]